MNLILTLFFSTISILVYSQEPSSYFQFLLQDSTNQEITEGDKKYQIKSLSINGMPKEGEYLRYLGVKDNVDRNKAWLIAQPYAAIRNYFWIQVVQQEIDTMNIFIIKVNEYHAYPSSLYFGKRSDFPTDTIPFTRGTYIINGHAGKPNLADWKNINASRIITQPKESIECYLKRENYDLKTFHN